MKREIFETDDYADLIYGATFQTDLTPEKILLILQTILAAWNDPKFEGFRGDLIKLDVHLLGIELGIRFDREKMKAKDFQHPTETQNRLSVQFIFYIFALVNQIEPLDEQPFFPEFHAFIQFPELI